MIIRPLLFILCLASVVSASDLQTITGAELVSTSWGDGDSFRVRFPTGENHTIRLYGADCMEWHISGPSDARRLREQRRYFGISDYGGDPSASIELAKALGEAAAVRVRDLLSDPFTVYTAHADGRGDRRFKRVYAFVQTEGGEDLATLLISEGLARAHGVTRSTADGLTRDSYRESLKDSELIAARAGKGIWKYTDWTTISYQRRLQRMEKREEALAMGTAEPTESIPLNAASRNDLMRIPGVGPSRAAGIIEARPFKSIDELVRVHGIGAHTLEALKPWVRLDPAP